MWSINHFLSFWLPAAPKGEKTSPSRRVRRLSAPKSASAETYCRRLSAAGKTSAAAAVWGSEIPYLSSVDSPEGEEVPNYHSQVVLTAEEVRTAALAQYPGADLSGDPSGWFSQPVENSAGGVASVDLGGVTLTGSEVRALFGLRSASFSVSWDGEAFTFDVTGYGHGVGMSQYGANAMAREGSDFEEILTWYYTGTEVGELYGAAGE